MKSCKKFCLKSDLPKPLHDRYGRVPLTIGAVAELFCGPPIISLLLLLPRYQSKKERSIMLSRAVVTLSAVSLFTFAGCGKKAIEFGGVTGIVRVGGQPQGGLIVRYLPDPAKGNDLNINATGRTDAQGKYTLTHVVDGKEAPGAPVGWHRVVIEDTSRGPTPQGQTPLPPLISPSYSSPATTPLSKEVLAGAQTIDLDPTK